jgi:rRNA maturation endonuclease Nob1
MAMISCTECGKQISTSAKSCPNCGSTSHRRKIWPWIVGVPAFVFIAMLIYGSTIPEYQSRAREVRELCEKIAPFQKDVCRANYDKAIAEGRSKSMPPPAPYVPSPAELKRKAAEDAVIKSAQIQECKTDLDAKISVYKRQMASGEYWLAAQALQLCANVTDDKRTKDLVADAEIKEYIKNIELKSTPRQDRIRMINALIRDYPDRGAKYQKLLIKLEREDGQ